jgi:hypothetical protein
MGYFSNGSEGMDYEERYCARCVHFGPTEGPGCPIWGFHLQWNYDACDGDRPDAKPEQKLKHMVLEGFIPRDKDGRNGQCKMFEPAGKIA